MTPSCCCFNSYLHLSRIFNGVISLFAAGSISSLGIAFLLAAMALAGSASAQTTSNAIVAPGNAVVTGFSGALPPAEIAPGQDPGDLTLIDPKGPSAQVFNLQAPGAPQAQVVGAPILFTVTAAKVGQVFGIALDNALPPNIYVAATSAYGLPIVVPGKGGVPVRVRQGSPGATFMAGLFGPGGGPGSIWRIDGISGAVRLFATVTQNGAANSGPALGGLTFDAASNSLLVADRQTGVIHSFNLSGVEIGNYDHGVQGLAAAGRPRVPYSPNHRDITDANFASDNPASWGYAPPERRIFGLAVHGGRLYYAVAAKLQVWSVGLAADGSFGNDARMEVQAPQPAPREIAAIAFDDRGDMILAERGAPTGDYEMTALTQAGVGRVLRYSPTVGSTGAQSAWQLEPGQYAIGFPLPFSNANGGVAVGYGYAANGNLDPASCGGFLWSTGEDLRNTTNGGLLPDLAANGALNLNGLEGNGIAAVAPANVPPLLSYFVDYDAQFDDPAIRGYLGDIAISRPCFQHAVLPGPAEAPGSAETPPIVGGAATPLGGPLYPPPPLLPPDIPPKPPSGSCPGGVFNSVTGGCCPSGPLVNPVTGACQPNCPPGQPRNPITNQCCPSGTTPQLNGTCVPPLALPLTGCQVLGETTFCSNLDLGINVQCPAGQAMPNGLCCPSSTKPTALGCMATNAGCGGGGIASLCCPAGRAANFANNSCCQIGQIFDAKSGQCVTPPTPPPPPPTLTCSVGSTIYCEAQANPNCPSGESVPDGCCPSGSQANIGMCIASGPTACGPSIPSMCCPSGQVPDYLANACLTPPVPPATHLRATPRAAPSGNTCAPGYAKVGSGCCLLGQATSKGRCCPAGESPNAGGMCKAIPRLTHCPSGQTLDRYTNTCVTPSCPAGQTRGPAGLCACPADRELNADTGKCVPLRAKKANSQIPPAAPCPSGDVMNPDTGKCQYIPTTPVLPIPCPAGEVVNPDTGKCQYIPTTPVLPIPCPAGEVVNPDTGKCQYIPTTPVLPLPCPAGEVVNPDTGKCQYIPTTPVLPLPCPSGEVVNPDTGKCQYIPTTPIIPLPCPSGEVEAPNGECTSPRPMPNIPVPPPAALGCAIGYTIGPNGMCVRNSVVCPPRTGEVPGPHGACVCPTGSTLGPTGACVCANGDLANGRECGPAPARPCPPDQRMSNGGCCPNGSMALPGGGCSMVCAPGQVQEPNGNCGPIPTPPPSGGCPAGEVANPAGGCLPRTFVPPTPQPIPPSIPGCPPGMAPGADGCNETSPQKPPCAAGFERNAAGACISAKKPSCPEGEERNADGACVPIRKPERPALPKAEKTRIAPKRATPRLAPQKLAPRLFTNKKRG